MSETKVCLRCGQEKPIEDFSKSYKNLCKACVADNERKKRNDKAPCNGFATIAIPKEAYISPMRLQVATAAMQGLLANSTWMSQASIREVTSSAVELADALIDELSKGKK